MSIERVINNMEGYDVPFHFPGELRAMNRTADGVTNGVIVSIGSFRGQMDCAIALHAHVPVYCIDPRQGWVGESRNFGDEDRRSWMHNIASLGLETKVRPIELPSHDVSKVWKQPIGLLWIDGNHVEIHQDLDDWLPWVIDGGLVAVHDNNSEMIITAVTQFDSLVEIERADLTTIYRREDLYEICSYEGINFKVRKGPYNKDDKYVLAEVRSYDIGNDPVRTCIDVGGHIGAFTAWIKHAWPGAQITAVEPELSNFNVLRLNTEQSGIELINGIVTYSPEAQLLVVDPVNSGCHKVIPNSEMSPGQSVIPIRETITLEQIMEDRGWESLDLLKVDAEGAEVDIFANCTDEFLRATRRIVGEFHFGVNMFWDSVGKRLTELGFEVTAETNPAAHSTFLGINKNWVEPEPPIEYGAAVVKKKAGRPKKS